MPSVDLRAGRHQHLGDHAVARRRQRVLHLHRLEHHQHVAAGDRRARPRRSACLTSPGIGARMSSPARLLPRRRRRAGRAPRRRCASAPSKTVTVRRRPWRRRSGAPRPSTASASSPSAPGRVTSIAPPVDRGTGPARAPRSAPRAPPASSARRAPAAPRARSRPAVRPRRAARRPPAPPARQHLRADAGAARSAPRGRRSISPVSTRPAAKSRLPRQPRQEPEVGRRARDPRRVERRAPAAPAPRRGSARARSAWRSSGRSTG